MFIRSLRELNFEKYTTATPIFEENHFSYKREEKAGHITCHSRKMPMLKELVINGVAQKILEYCDGTRTTVEIGQEMAQLFKEVPMETIMHDLTNVMFNYSKCGIVSWAGGENPFMYEKEIELKNGEILSLARESDLRALCAFMGKPAESDMLSYTNPTRQNAEYHEEVAYRQKLFSYTEEYFVVREKNDAEIKGLLTVLIPTANNSTVSSIGVVKMAPNKISECIEFAMNLLPEIAVKEISKVKFMTVEGDSEHTAISNEFTQSGFIKECTLAKELGFKNMDVYSYIY